MVNLILNTDAWINLANGYNSKTNKHGGNDLHFEIAEWMLKKMKSFECRIFSNYIIKIEWERNRDKCNCLIEKYEKQLKHEGNALKKKRGGKPEEFLQKAREFRKFEKKIKEKIEKNKKHIKIIGSL